MKDRKIQKGDRMLGLFGHRGSQITAAFVALHRNRLTTLLIGGKRLSFMVVWDSKASESVVPLSETEAAALRVLVDADLPLTPRP